DGTSLLWESLGRKFTGLSYQEADRLSQQNKEFIRALFPQDPLYATLLPANVQELIGQVGPETQAVERMLREIGFSYAHRIDPFDGGPHFHARTDEIALVRALGRARLGPEPAAARTPPRPLLVAREQNQPPYFRAARVSAALPPPGTNDATLVLSLQVARQLGAALGEEVAYILLSPLPAF